MRWIFFIPSLSKTQVDYFGLLCWIFFSKRLEVINFVYMSPMVEAKVSEELLFLFVVKPTFLCVCVLVYWCHISIEIFVDSFQISPVVWNNKESCIRLQQLCEIFRWERRVWDELWLIALAHLDRIYNWVQRYVHTYL